MKSRSRSNTLLIELLLVIFFFMCSAGILVQIYRTRFLRIYRPGWQLGTAEGRIPVEGGSQKRRNRIRNAPIL